MKGNLFLGVDIGGTKTSISIGHEDGSILAKRRFFTRRGVEQVLLDCQNEISLLLSSVGNPRLDAIGISCGGPLDSKKGIIQSPPNLPGWDEVPIVKWFEKTYGVPAFLENDANACALAEWYWGNGKGSSSLVFLTFGTGLGAGLILDGRLFRGACGLAGEIGHWRLSDVGPLCYGKEGSWESFCSGSGLCGLYERQTGTKMSAKEICDLAESGEAVALGVLELSARMLGRGLALLVDLLNPEKIIIGSIFSRSEELFRTHMEWELKKEALGLSFESCQVVPCGLGENLGDMAALGIAKDHVCQKE